MAKEKKVEYAELAHILKPKSVAIIGATDKLDKVGHIIMQNYLEVGFQGPIYPININAGEKIMGRDAFRSILDVKKEIDLAVISIPAAAVPAAFEQCCKARVKGAVIISGGFAEVGNQKLQDKLVEISRKYKVPFIGPNCLGVMDTRARNDTLFLPTNKIDRPKIGNVSFVSQSGSVGSSTLDLMSGEGFGLARFISYGNAAVVDEVDILNYLAHDNDTKVIVFYLEGVRRGKEFIEVAKRATATKPIIIIKGGSTELGSKAAHSHTASLAGSKEAYDAVFKQFGFIRADSLDDLLFFGKIFATQPPLTTNNRIGVITNGGGHGVLATDALYENNLALPEMSKNTEKALRKAMPPIVNITMPLDIGGEADAARYDAALEILEKDPSIDAIMCITLFQTPGADERTADMIIKHNGAKQKPMVVVSTGGSYTRSHTAKLESFGVPVYESPTDAARALEALINYSRYRNKV